MHVNIASVYITILGTSLIRKRENLITTLVTIRPISNGRESPGRTKGAMSFNISSNLSYMILTKRGCPR